MKPLNYRPPVDDGGNFSAWVNDLRNQSGAYIIRHARTHEVLYVGESHTGNLAKTIKRHFWIWRDDTDRQHFTCKKFDVEVAVRVTPPNTAKAAQDNLIRRLMPSKNDIVPF